MIRELYMKKENRDARFNELRANGERVRKSSTHNQLIHPQYIEDYPDLAVKADNDVGNCHYKTHFSKLYQIESV